MKRKLNRVVILFIENNMFMYNLWYAYVMYDFIMNLCTSKNLGNMCYVTIHEFMHL